MITGIAHVCFCVEDLDRSRDFYCKKLGLSVAFEMSRGNEEPHGLYLNVGRRTFIELFLAKLAPPAAGQSYQHLCLEVDDVNETVWSLRSRGVEVSDPRLGNDHAWQAWLTDPDGNRIELHCYISDSLQTASLRD